MGSIVSHNLNAAQFSQLQASLQSENKRLRDAITTELYGSDNPHFEELAGRVHDHGEESVTEQVEEINHATVEHHMRELAEVTEALNRVEEGGYGVCIDCDSNIGFGRLNAYPMATRCVACQTGQEEKRERSA